MMDTTPPNPLTQLERSYRIVYLGIVGSVLILTALGSFFTSALSPKLPLHTWVEVFLSLAGVLTAFAAWRINRYCWSKEQIERGVWENSAQAHGGTSKLDSQESVRFLLLRKLFPITLVTYALSEATVFFGFLLAILLDDPLKIIPFSAMGMVTLVLQRPRRLFDLYLTDSKQNDGQRKHRSWS